MRKDKKTVLATLILLSLLVQTTSLMLVTNAQSPPAEQFSIINPGPSSYPSGWNASSTVRYYNTSNFVFYNNETGFDSTFFMNVTVTNVTNLFGWGIGIVYDNATLQFVRAWLPPDNVFAGAVDAGGSVVAPSPVISPFNATYQEVEYGASFTPPTPPWSFNGTGTLAQVEFQIIAEVNNTNPQVSSSFTFDPAWTDVYFWPSGSEVPTLNTGNFAYAWAAAHSLTVVVTSPTSTAVGSAVNCTATVTGSNPTGTVTWSTNSSTGSFSPSVCTLSSGTCSTMYNDTSLGTANITASYSGDSHNLPSNGTTTLTVTLPSVAYTVTFIESGLPQSSPWSVTFNGKTNNSTSNSIMFTEQNGNYSYSVTEPSGFTASPKDGNVTVNGTGVNVSITFTPTLAKSSTSVVCSPNPGAANSSITCTAQVTGSNPTGTVTWSTNSSTGSFSPSVCTLSSGTCSTMYNDTSLGTANITASYSGDSNNLPSNGTSILTLTAPSRHDVVVSSVSASAIVTQGVLLSISVAVLNDGTATETSVLVNATVDGTLIGSQQIVLSLPAGNTTTLVFNWNTTDVPVGTYNVTVTVTPVLGQTDLSGISKTTTVQVLEAALEQYYLTVTSAYDSPSPSSGWFDIGTNITESVTSPVSGGKGVQYVCTGWNGTGSIPASGAASFVTFEITANSTITWNWETQFQVTFDQSGVGSDFTGTVVTVDSVNYSVRGLPVSFWWDSGSSQTFSFTSPLIVNTNKQYVWSSTSGLSTQQSGTLTVTASGSVVGNYATVSSHQMPPLVSPWLFLGFIIALGLIGASVLFMLIGMDLTIKKRKKKKDANL